VSIASELKASITPEEKQHIEKKPAINLTAYYFYQKGEKESRKYWKDGSNKATIQKAEEFYRKALETDSTYALAYLGLGDVYAAKYQFNSYFSDN
jgi:hypothetical protein